MHVLHVGDHYGAIKHFTNAISVYKSQHEVEFHQNDTELPQLARLYANRYV